MEFSFSDEPKKGSAPATKMYSPKKKAAKHGGVADKNRARVKAEDAAESTARRSGSEPISAASRIGIMLSGFLFAGMVLFTLTGYERISRAYADINTINSAIDAAELRIKALDVQIECAVTIQDAQETAERYGMRYPTQSQYVRAGDTIPVFGSAPSGTVNGLGATVVPGETAPETAPETTTPPAETEPPEEDVPSDD